MNDRSDNPYRVLVAKAGLDGHDRGVKLIARALRDEGFEVIYSGLRRSPAQIVDIALQEDVDAVGLSVLSGAHMTLFAEIMGLLHERGMDDVLVFGGGIIPESDKAALRAAGVAELFSPGTPLAAITEWLRAALASPHPAGELT